MRDRAHYLDMLECNPNASIGVQLAAKMVLAPELDDGSFTEDVEALRATIRRLKSEYGETMTRVQVRAEMGLMTCTERMLPLHPKIVKVEIR